MQAFPKRYSWLEWANVLAMFFVVLFHIPSEIENPIRSVEYIAVNVPFFILSGVSFRIYLEHRKDNLSFVEFAKSRLKRFGPPTVIFFSFFYLLWLLVGKKLAGDTEEWYIPLVEFLTGNLVTVLSTYWFIFCLLTIQLIYFIIYSFTKSSLIILGICILLHFINQICDIPSYYQMVNAMTFIPFFAMGTCYSFNSEHEYKAMALPIIFIIIYGVLSISGYNDVNIDVSKGYIIGICLTVFLISGSYLFSQFWGCPHFISFLRAGALVLLATQNNIIGICKVLLDKITGSHDYLAHHIYFKPITFLMVYIVSSPIILFFLTKKGRKLNCI